MILRFDNKQKARFCTYQELFSSKTKYDSHSGWPSFYDVIDNGRVVLFEDLAEGMHRIEGQCM